MKDPNEIVLHVGTTRTWIQILPSNPWAPVIREITKQKLSDYEFDPRWKRYKVSKRYLWYDNKSHRLYIPANVTPFIRDSLENIGAPFKEVKEHLVEPRKINVHMKEWFKPREKQIPVIKYLTGEKPYRKGLATYTGSGKTISSLAAMVQSGGASMICVSGLTSQWIRAIFEFTDAKPEDVYEIKGFQSLFELLASDLKPAFIVCSLETIRMYVYRQGNYAELPPYEKFLDYFGIRNKLFDEVHKCFHTTTMIDLHSNVLNNMYLTATFTSSSRSTLRVFNMIYPKEMQFNPDTLQRYLKGVAIMYYGNVPLRASKRMRGYFHAGIENYYLTHKRMLDNFYKLILQPVIHSYYINYADEGEKCLIYFSKIDMIEWMVKTIQASYPEKKVIAFVGGVPDKAMEEADIGITNAKRAGTGCDIKGLRTVINTVSIQAEGLVIQLRGRLRRLENGNQPVYVELIDKLNPSQMHHYEFRKRLHEQWCADFEEQNW